MEITSTKLHSKFIQVATTIIDDDTTETPLYYLLTLLQTC